MTPEQRAEAFHRRYRARRLIDTHRAIGYTFRTAGGKLKVGPSIAITPRLESEIAEYRAEIIAALTFDAENPTLAAISPDAPLLSYAHWRRQVTNENFSTGRIYDPNPPAVKPRNPDEWPASCYACGRGEFVRRGRGEFTCLNCYPGAPGEHKEAAPAC